MKLRIVFQSGRDLNIFDCVEQNLDGSWNRYTDSKGRQYIVDPAKVNYIEVKTVSKGDAA
jgi:hypothetical protein